MDGTLNGWEGHQGHDKVGLLIGLVLIVGSVGAEVEDAGPCHISEDQKEKDQHDHRITHQQHRELPPEQITQLPYPGPAQRLVRQAGWRRRRCQRWRPLLPCFDHRLHLCFRGEVGVDEVEHVLGDRHARRRRLAQRGGVLDQVARLAQVGDAALREHQQTANALVHARTRLMNRAHHRHPIVHGHLMDQPHCGRCGRTVQTGGRLVGDEHGRLLGECNGKREPP